MVTHPLCRLHLCIRTLVQSRLLFDVRSRLIHVPRWLYCIDSDEGGLFDPKDRSRGVGDWRPAAPKPGPGEVLVRVHATAVTPTEFDWSPTFNTGNGEPRPFPIILSHEFSGVEEQVGEAAEGFKSGCRLWDERLVFQWRSS